MAKCKAEDKNVLYHTYMSSQHGV